MKILIVQLARFGDICLTWPTIKSIRRTHPGAEIHICVRDRFSEIARLIDSVDQIHPIDVQGIFAQYNQEGVDSCIEKVKTQLDLLKNEKYDSIFNLTYSPASSFLTHYIAKESANVVGYTRQEDGFLKIEDEISAYIFGQAGPGRENRYHLSDLFATAAGVELKYQDWSIEEQFSNIKSDNRKKLVVHLGASQRWKTLSKEQWTTAIQEILEDFDGVIYLIGDSSEDPLSSHILESISDPRVIDLVGNTTLKDIFELIASATVYVGPDSAPLHIASLLQVPIINVSVGNVNFWETGPKASRSSVLSSKFARDFEPFWIADELSHILSDGEFQSIGVKIDSPLSDISDQSMNSPAWEMIQFVYTGGVVPKVSNNQLNLLIELAELCDVAIQQIRTLSDEPTNRFALGILDRCDQAMTLLEPKSPEIGVLIRWLMTEKTRIGPGNVESILKRTREIYFGMGQMLGSLLEAAQAKPTKGATHAK